MSDDTISIPDTLYDKAQRVAKQHAQSVETIIRTRLEGIGSTHARSSHRRAR